MKVTTIACIQGAWLPNFSPSSALDIGAGTGLLSFMAHQQYACHIDSVEIDQNAFEQLAENVKLNDLSKKVKPLLGDIADFAKDCSKRYDFIISNPPFFSNQLRSPDPGRTIARHTATLDLNTLLDVSCSLLNDEGLISILLPAEETNHLSMMLPKHGLHFRDQLHIRDTARKPVKAIISILSKSEGIKEQNSLILKQADGSYTESFVSLLKDYYLYL